MGLHVLQAETLTTFILDYLYKVVSIVNSLEIQLTLEQRGHYGR